MIDSANKSIVRTLSAFAALAMAAVLVVSGGTVAVGQDDAPTLREPGVILEPDDELVGSLADCDVVAALGPGEMVEVEDDVTVRIINGDPSAARYLAEEELANFGANTAVGQTSAFIGQLFADSDNNWVPCSRFDVDMRTLESDQSRRDNFLRNNTLESETYPVATFVLRAVEGLDGPMTDEEETFTLVGDFTFHGVTHLVAWEATAKLEGDALVATAWTDVGMAEFNIEPPIVGSVISIDEIIRLEVDIDAQPAA